MQVSDDVPVAWESFGLVSGDAPRSELVERDVYCE
jgi:hypothetical protein